MRKYFFPYFEVFWCIFIASFALYLHINKNNDLTALQLAIPQLEKEVKKLQKENESLQYHIDRFESPIHLMEFLKKPEFSHLKYPLEKDVIVFNWELEEKAD